MNKAEKMIRKYIESKKAFFTWKMDIVEHSIWGFKNAPYKNLKRAVTKVNSVIEKMVSEHMIEILEDGTIHYIGGEEIILL